ncbi:MAG: FtsW/RodA/SpoVE family cell cycle protein [Turicibacter sp.]|uniref:Cell division protein FtsW n=1 Tax=Turicibacter faecis TaxID=2963365 RepID=A0ABM8IJB4_9FIRM|nr:FtsW/RodA/SpoVE family cell cycle protein [Turicibacter sp. TA25]MCI8701459.1 FtsW/RodA/SpoVE family cell cycle protein [Turicibacter sp.]MCI9350656.1 FtsW/RodA/SpoVE family cell cycle protein [Turicibacter sp.]MCU7203960.1 FtsW/RodA/SpoVE family cell cycle protein [Turicibacter sp. TA25]BEH91327.1 cell division protein FtsW [Turicibacter sp. TC023]
MRNILNKFKVLFYNPIIVYLILIIGIGVVAIQSASPLFKINYAATHDNNAFKQLLFIGIGAVIAVFIIIIGIERIRALRWWIYGFWMIPLLGLFAYKKLHLPIPFVKDLNGAVSWYELPGGLGTIQPSEFMKIGLVLVVADIIQRHNERYPHIRRTFKTDLNLLMKIMAAILPPSILIFIQPDSGVTMIILFFIAIMIFSSGIQWRYILTVGGIVIVLMATFILLVGVFPEFLTGTLGIDAYKLSRFFGWFDPFGTMDKDGMQLAKGLLAIGSGNLIGNGFQSAHVYFPEAHTDFIFAVIGMDFGLIGTLITITLCGLFDYEILNTATLNRGHYNSYVCIGIFGMLFFQQIQNIGMTIGLLPITGITLPFISYGGSSSLSYMILFGIVLASYIEGIKIKHNEVDYHERTLYLKTKAYIKDNVKFDD